MKMGKQGNTTGHIKQKTGLAAGWDRKMTPGGQALGCMKKEKG